MVEGLAAAVDALIAADPATLSDGETIVALHRQLERLAAVVSRADAAFDAGRYWDSDGARSSAAWISTRCRLPMATARRSVRLGRALRAMPATERGWAGGEIGEAQAEARAITRKATAERERLQAEALRVRALLQAALATIEPVTPADGANGPAAVEAA